jgi:hypothetical protein
VACWPGTWFADYDPARVTQWRLAMHYSQYRPEAIAQAKAIHAALNTVCGFEQWFKMNETGIIWTRQHGIRRQAASASRRVARSATPTP